MKDSYFKYQLDNGGLKFIETNDQGFSFYLHKDFTSWANNNLKKSKFAVIAAVKDESIKGYLLYTPNGVIDLEYTPGQDSAETIATRIDMHKLIMNDELD
jgi:hypothetical protein